jgi:membrane protein
MDTSESEQITPSAVLSNTADQSAGQTVHPPTRKRLRLRHWAFQLNNNKNHLLASIRCCLRIFFIMAEEFEIAAISLRASALTYSVMLSLVPILAMSTAVLKGLGSDNQLKIAAYKIIDQFEQDEKKIEEIKVQAGDKTAAIEKIKEEKSLTEHMRTGVDMIFGYVDKTNFATIGAFGIVGLLFSVILVLSSIEAAMNAIWHTRHGRSFFRKIMDYLALLILLPISINIALAGDAILASPKILAYISSIGPSEWAIQMLLQLLPFLFVVLTLMFMFLFFPNVKVHKYAAFSGAVFASIFWFIVQKSFILLQLGVTNYNAIYGSFATLPLLLIWAHLGWTFILLGASLAYAIQNRNHYHLPGMKKSPEKKLQLAFDILDSVYQDFESRKITTLDALMKRHPGELYGNIQDIIDILTRGQLLHCIEKDEIIYSPSVPAETLEAKEVVRLFLGDNDPQFVKNKFAAQIMTAAESAIAKDEFPSKIITNNLPSKKD